MKRPSTMFSPDRNLPDAAADAAAIDARYGLEPVFEPETPAIDSGEGQRIAGEDTADSAPFACVCCPYCGESFETRLDLSAGSTAYIEDCQVCCRPIEFCLTVDASHVIESLELRRSD